VPETNKAANYNHGEAMESSCLKKERTKMKRTYKISKLVRFESCAGTPPVR